MKTFLEFIREEALQGSLGIARINMPQIAQKDLPGFLEYSKEQGVGYSIQYVSPQHLLPTQHEFNQEKVDSFAGMTDKEYADLANVPVLASQDLRMADGHHRNLGLQKYAPHVRQKAICFQANIATLISLMNGYDKTFNRAA